MKIREIEAFQACLGAGTTCRRSAAPLSASTPMTGSSGIGEASPMQGGLASLGIIAHDLAPALIGQDPLDHAVLHDRCCTASSSSAPRAR